MPVFLSKRSAKWIYPPWLPLQHRACRTILSSKILLCRFVNIRIFLPRERVLPQKTAVPSRPEWKLASDAHQVTMLIAATKYLWGRRQIPESLSWQPAFSAWGQLTLFSEDMYTQQCPHESYEAAGQIFFQPVPGVYITKYAKHSMSGVLPRSQAQTKLIPYEIILKCFLSSLHVHLMGDKMLDCAVFLFGISIFCESNDNKTNLYIIVKSTLRVWPNFMKVD